MHKMEFSLAYCKYIHKWILKKFILYFSEFYFIFYVFKKSKHISRILNSEKKFEKRGRVLGSLPAQDRGPAVRHPAFAHSPRPKEACQAGPAPQAKSPHASSWLPACTRRGHRDHGLCSGAAPVVSGTLRRGTVSF
jgi:hypothetical protein